MKCPVCGHELTESLKRVPMPMPFTDPKKKRKRSRWTQKRVVYECATCGRAFIRTLALVETKILGD